MHDRSATMLLRPETKPTAGSKKGSAKATKQGAEGGGKKKAEGAGSEPVTENQVEGGRETGGAAGKGA